MEIKLFDPKTFTKEDWDRYHQFRKARHMETNPEDPYQPNEIVEKSLIQDFNNDQFNIKIYVITEKNSDSVEKQIGSAFLASFTKKNPSYEGNKHVVQFDVAILPEYRKQGIATKFLHEVVEYSKKNEIRVLITNTSEPSGKNFLTHIGFNLALSGKENRLLLSDVNWNMVDEWIAHGKKINPETQLLHFNRIPDDLIDQYAPFFTEVMNQQPLGDLDIDKLISTPETLRKRESEFQELGFISHIMVTLEKDGQISGMTEMIRMPSKGTILTQLLTGVKENQRGRKLGKWLKASMLFEMKNKYPQVTTITTGNADSNAPMLSINHRLGFKAYKETYLAQIELEKLVDYLSQKKTADSTVVII